MPVAAAPDVPRYIVPPVTNCDLDWADLAFIDLSQAKTPEGRIALTKQVRDAMTTTGFFYAINHGYTPEQTQRMLDIADIPFTQVSEEERAEYDSKLNESGTYKGYKPRSYWHIENGVRDQIDQYNLNLDVMSHEHPKALRPFLPEIAAFSEHNHFNILHPILKLIALGLELPEDELLPLHDFKGRNATWVRFMKYYPHSETDSAKAKNLWLKGHTDFGSVTMVWSQPVSALQIKSPDGTWKWVRHVDNAVVVNAGDWLEVYSAGFYKATIHRVFQPPADQQTYNRLGLYYFGLPNDEVPLSPNLNAPVLKRTSVNEFYKREQFMPGPTMEQFRTGRVSTYGKVAVRKGAEEGTEEHVVTGGFVVKHYL